MPGARQIGQCRPRPLLEVEAGGRLKPVFGLSGELSAAAYCRLPIHLASLAEYLLRCAKQIRTDPVAAWIVTSSKRHFRDETAYTGRTPGVNQTRAMQAPSASLGISGAGSDAR